MNKQQRQPKAQYPVRIVGRGHLETTGERFFIVSSASDEHRVHVVKVLAARLSCDCPASRFQGKCQHRQLVHDELVNERQAAKSVSQPTKGVDTVLAPAKMAKIAPASDDILEQIRATLPAPAAPAARVSRGTRPAYFGGRSQAKFSILK